MRVEMDEIIKVQGDVANACAIFAAVMAVSALGLIAACFIGG
jgi:hypothetical protein